MRYVVLFCALAIAVELIGGPEALSQHGLTVVGIILSYVVTGLCAGTLVGIFRAYLGTLTGAGAVGFSVGLVWGISARVILWGASPWEPGDIVFAFLFGIAGCVGAWAMRRKMRRM